jgi:hypothetical protein
MNERELEALQRAAALQGPGYDHSFLDQPGRGQLTNADAQRQAAEIWERATAPASALEVQVGGSHYRDLPIQPVEYIFANSISFFEGNVIKYVSRWRNKNGIADLEKAKHYLEMLIELETKKGLENPV